MALENKLRITVGQSLRLPFKSLEILVFLNKSKERFTKWHIWNTETGIMTER